MRCMFLSMFALLALIAALVGCDRVQQVIAPVQEQTPIKIGLLASGSRVTYPDSAAIAVAEVNARGGLFGTPVELVTRIEIEEAAEAVQIAETMIRDDKVIALIGPNRSTHAIEVGQIAQQYGVPMITTTATNPNVTNAGDFVFMAAMTDTFQGQVLAQFATEELGGTTAAILTQSGDVYTEGLSEFFVVNFTAVGGTIVANESYEGITTDFTGQLTPIAAATPDILFISGFAYDVVLVTQQARAIPLQNGEGEPTVFLGADSWDNPILLTSEAAEIEGSFFSAHFSLNTDEPRARTFIDTYHSLYGVFPTGGEAVSYDCFKLIFEAIERAGSLDPIAIREQLAATENYVGATRIDSYDENRHPTKSVVIFTIKNGEKQFYKQIDPF